MLTLRPDASTWSRPPKPMSYAQPSPPTIQTPWRTRSSASASSWRASARIVARRSGRGARGARRRARAARRSPARSSCGASSSARDEVRRRRPAPAARAAAGPGRSGRRAPAASRGRTRRCPRTASCPRRAAAVGVDRPRASSAGCRRRSTSSRWRWRRSCGRRTAGSPASGTASRRSRRTRRENSNSGSRTCAALDGVVGDEAARSSGGIAAKKSQRTRSASRWLEVRAPC